jgi:AcrR family transcriptional regulator
MRGRKKSQETRSAIVRCAEEVFAQREFHEVLTEDIAQRLGIGKGTIYRYFDSKEALYLAAIHEGLSGLHAAVTAVLQQNAPIEVTVEAVVRTMIDYFWRRRDFFALIQRLEQKFKPRQRADWRKQRADVTAMVRRVLERAAARGEVTRVNGRLATEALFGMIRGVCLYRADGDRPDEVTRLVTTLFLRGLAPSARTPHERVRPLRIAHAGGR